MAINSIFPEISTSERLQVFIDSRNDKFAQPWYSKYFSMGVPQLSLNYVSILGESKVAAMASVVSRDGETPLRSRDALGKLYGEIPAIKVMRKLNESQYRDYMSLQSLNVSDETKKNQAFGLIWNDIEYVKNATEKRLDYLCAQGLSTGKIKLDVDNNPDGVVIDELDLMMPNENQSSVTTSWDNATTATPLQDILLKVREFEAQGVTFGKMLMDSSLFQKFLATKEVKEVIGTFFGVSASARQSATSPLTNARVNEYLTASQLPIIEVVNVRVAVQKDGKNTVVNPFSESNVVFIPDGNLGEIKNAIAVEEQKPVTNLVYAKSNATLISKWSQNEPFGEWTKAELNAFPSFDMMNQIVLLTAIV